MSSKEIKMNACHPGLAPGPRPKAPPALAARGGLSPPPAGQGQGPGPGPAPLGGVIPPLRLITVWRGKLCHLRGV